MKLQSLVIFFFCCVYFVLGETSFIPKGQRAEIFELTDNEVPVFRITLSDDEYNLLKRKASLMDTDNFKNINGFIKEIIELINNQNFNEIFPGYNFKEILPELPMNENGHPNIDYEKFYIDINNLHYINFAYIKRSFYNIFKRNSYLDLINVFHTLNNLDVSSEVDKAFMGLIREFGTDDIKKFDNIDDLNEKISNTSEIHDYFGYNYGINNDDFPGFDYDSPSFGFDYDSQISGFDYDSPSSGFDYDFLNSSFDYDSPSSGFYYDSPSSGFDYDSPSSGWDYDFPNFENQSFNWYYDSSNSNLNYDSPSSTVDDDNLSFNFIKSLRRYLEINQKFDNMINEDELIDLKFNEFNSNDFYEYFKGYNFDKNIDNNHFFSLEEVNFKTKNATLIVEINNGKKVFDKITFSLSGSYSRNFSKPNYNLKIRGKDELFGRRQFKLRGDASEPTYMRTKLVSDIRNRVGMPSLSANYAILYVNNEYYGLYIFTDAYKESWIEYVYGEKDTQLLYKCNYGILEFVARSFFENENKEATNKKELYEFLAEMTKAKSASDVESIFDLDQFFKEIAVDVLVSSWDHIVHNYYIYKNKKNNKWIYLSHDYDLDMGMNHGASMKLEQLYFSDTIRKLVSKDDPRFKKIMSEIVSKVFNPATLYPHIDEIKSFIRPYVELDKIPDENGQYPGRINKFASDFYSMKQWEDSVEFKNFSTDEFYKIYALKKFILLKYRDVCHDYELECDPVYLDRNYGKELNITDNLIMDDLNNKKEQIEIDFENEVETPSKSTETKVTSTLSSEPIQTTSLNVNDTTDILDTPDNDDDNTIDVDSTDGIIEDDDSSDDSSSDDDDDNSEISDKDKKNKH